VGNQTFQIQESTGCSKLADAEMWLNTRIQQIRDEALHGTKPTMLLVDAATRYLEESKGHRSFERSAGALANIVPELGHLPLKAVHDGTLKPYIDKRLKDVKPATVERELAVVRRILTLAARKWRTESGQTYLDTPPLLTVPKGEARRPYPINREQEARLMRELPEYMKPVIAFAINTGMRAGEIRNLTWDQEVYLPSLGCSVFVLGRTKNGEERVVVLNSIARLAVDAQRGKHPEYVFTHKGDKLPDLSNRTYFAARERAGIPQFRIHDARHTTGARLREAEVPLEDRKALLGHTTGDITSHYSSASLKKLLEYVERIVDGNVDTVLRTTIAQRLHNADSNVVPFRAYQVQPIEGERVLASALTH
jgi:integrase